MSGGMSGSLAIAFYKGLHYPSFCMVVLLRTVRVRHHLQTNEEEEEETYFNGNKCT